MTTIVDRGTEKDGSDTASRTRFRERYKSFAKKAIDRAIKSGNVTNIGSGGVDVTVPRDDLSQPRIHHGPGGVRHHVIPGNRKYEAGDRAPRGGGGGNGPGKGNGEGADEDGEGTDDFTFHLSEEEFLQYLFEDLELPNMEAKNQADIEDMQMRRSGIVSSGPHNKLDLIRSRNKKTGRVIASSKGYKECIIALLEEEASILSPYSNEKINAANLDWQASKKKILALEARLDLLRDFTSATTALEQSRLLEIHESISAFKRKVSLIPSWNESTDLRFRNFTPQPKPNSRAVMICQMDVSGSVSEQQKADAKIFFFLLYRFLKKQYDQTDIVFVRYHSSAREVDEKEFFYGTDSGGTVVSNSVELSLEILSKRYPKSDWNIYSAHASDGDNSSSDNSKTANLLKELVNLSQASFYVEMPHGATQQLWQTYQDLKSKNPEKCFAGLVNERKDIWPLFRSFFTKSTNINRGVSAASYMSLNR